MPIYDKPVRLLLRDMVTAFGLSAGQEITRDQAVKWFAQTYPKIKQGTVVAHLIRLSTNNRNRLHYGVRQDGSDDLLFQVSPGRYRLYDSSRDPQPIRDAESVAAPPTPPSPEEVGDAFAYEHDLRDYLAKNLSHIEAGLKLYIDEDEAVSGLEFPAGGRFIDILAVAADGSYVVIELKVSKGYDRVVGQLLRYMAWIEKHHAEPGVRVRGVVVAKDITEDLQLACGKVPDVELFEYRLAVSLTKVQ